MRVLDFKPLPTNSYHKFATVKIRRFWGLMSPVERVVFKPVNSANWRFLGGGGYTPSNTVENLEAAYYAKAEMDKITGDSK